MHLVDLIYCPLCCSIVVVVVKKTLDGQRTAGEPLIDDKRCSVIWAALARARASAANGVRASKLVEFVSRLLI